MQFRPFMPPEDLPLDSEGELQIPDELSELALQLEAEAQQLAHLYPVQPDLDLEPDLEEEDEFIEVVNKSESLVPALSWQWISASVVAGITLAFCSLIQWNEPATEQPHDSAAPIVRHSGTSAPKGSPSHVLPAVSQPLTPDVDLLRMSGPELEGMLDWLESSDRPRVVQVSM